MDAQNQSKILRVEGTVIGFAHGRGRVRVHRRAGGRRGELRAERRDAPRRLAVRRLLAVETQVARVVELGDRLAALGEAARDLVDRAADARASLGSPQIRRHEDTHRRERRERDEGHAGQLRAAVVVGDQDVDDVRGPRVRVSRRQSATGDAGVDRRERFTLSRLPRGDDDAEAQRRAAAPVGAQSAGATTVASRPGWSHGRQCAGFRESARTSASAAASRRLAATCAFVAAASAASPPSPSASA